MSVEKKEVQTLPTPAHMPPITYIYDNESKGKDKY